LVALTQFIIWIAMSVTAAFFLNTGFAAMQKNIPAGQEELMKNMDFQQIATEVSHILLDMNYIGIIGVFVFFFCLATSFTARCMQQSEVLLIMKPKLSNSRCLRLFL
jgi:ABC-2 type transport system permease protein